MIDVRTEKSISGERWRGQVGAALAIAVFGLFVIGLLIGTAVLLAQSERRNGRGFLNLQRALAAAETGLHKPLTTWNTVGYGNLPVGGESAFSGPGPIGQTGFAGSVHRLSQRLFLITSMGEGPGGVRQAVGMVVRLDPVVLPSPAALTLSGRLEIKQGATLSGRDAQPAGWRCEPGTAPVPGLLISPADSASGLIIECFGSDCISGDPPILTDTSVVQQHPSALLPEEVARLRRLAAVQVARPLIRPEPAWINETCVTARQDNWGDPYPSDTPCRSYFPLVFVGGDLEIRGGRGQGVLVVDGDLSVTGSFTYAGLVLVNGTVMIAGLGTRIYGAVMVADSRRGQSQVAAGASISYSSCGLRRAVIGSGQPWPLERRSWFRAY